VFVFPENSVLVLDPRKVLWEMSEGQFILSGKGEGPRVEKKTFDEQGETTQLRRRTPNKAALNYQSTPRDGRAAGPRRKASGSLIQERIMPLFAKGVLSLYNAAQSSGKDPSPQHRKGAT